MKTSRQIERQAKRLFRLCVVDGSVDAGRTRQLVQRVIAGRHRGYLTLLSRFLRLVRLDQEAHTAAVETAAPLPQELRANVQALLQGKYGPGMNFQFAEKPALIGGMRIKAGNNVYDGSVQFELAALEESF
ncbi:MAG TPA: F0F1 ATP synthase subunit delta [Candidatus Angelobacter sp.]